MYEYFYLLPETIQDENPFYRKTNSSSYSTAHYRSNCEWFWHGLIKKCYFNREKTISHANTCINISMHHKLSILLGYSLVVFNLQLTKFNWWERVTNPTRVYWEIGHVLSHQTFPIKFFHKWISIHLLYVSRYC